MLSGQSSGLLYSAPLQNGDAGPAQTIAMLRCLVDDAWKDPFVNRTAIDIIRNAGVQPYDSWGQIRAIYNFASTFYFVNDPVMKEAVRPTRELLKLMAGDCDDINGNVIPALLGTIGYETRLVTIAADDEAPEAFSHVYAEVLVDGEWYPLDAARPGAVFGEAPPFWYRRKWWNLTDSSSGDYPADCPDGSMAGYTSRTIRGLNGVTGAPMVDPQGNLIAVGGQRVQHVVGRTIGPGGAAYYQQATRSAPCGCGSDSATGILPWVVLGLLFWAVS